MSEKLPPHNLRFDEARFWQLLSASVALAADQKQTIVNNIPKYTQRQIDHLMRVLADEQRGLQQFANQEMIENMRYASAQEWQNTIDSRHRGHEENCIQRQLHVLLNYRRNVLVVGEDIEQMRQYLKPLAQKRRYRLCYLVKPKLLVEQLRHGFYDAVLLQDDNHHSISYLRQVKRYSPDLPVALVASGPAAVNIGQVVEAIKNGAEDYLPALPLSLDKLDHFLEHRSERLTASQPYIIQEALGTKERFPYFHSEAGETTTRVIFGYRLQAMSGHLLGNNDYIRLLDGLLHLTNVTFELRVTVGRSDQDIPQVNIYILCGADFSHPPTPTVLEELHRDIYTAFAMFLENCYFEKLDEQQLDQVRHFITIGNAVGYRRKCTDVETPSGVRLPYPWLPANRWNYLVALIEKLVNCRGKYIFAIRFSPIDYLSEYEISATVKEIVSFLQEQSADTVKIISCENYIEQVRVDEKEDEKLQKSYIKNMSRSLDRLYWVKFFLASDRAISEKENNLIASELTGGYKSLLQIDHFRSPREIEQIREQFAQVILARQADKKEQIVDLTTPLELGCYLRIPSVGKEQISGLRVEISPNLPPPTNLAENGVMIGLGERSGRQLPIFISPADRSKHSYIIGKTGVGKTTLIESMFLQDIYRGDGAVLLDPLGDLAQGILGKIPRERLQDVIYFTPITEQPIGISIFEAQGAIEQSYMIGEFISIMIELYGDEIFGPRIQDYTRGFLLTMFAAKDLLDYSPALSDMVRLLNRDNFLKITAEIKRKSIERYREIESFIDLITNQGSREGTEMMPYFRAKFSPLIETRIMRLVFCQRNPQLDFNQIIRDKRIFIANLSKGLISEYNANLAGMLLLAKFKAAYLRRINLPREQRHPYHLYVDEFHNFCSMSFAAMLAESRQYGITVTLANQFLSQLDFKRWGVASKTVDALLGNVGNLITFRVGVKDAQIFEGEYGGMVPANSITALKNWTAFAKILVNGQTTRPFTIKTVPFRGEDNRSALEYIKRQSELKYGYNSSLEDRLTDFTKLVERL